MKKINLVLIVTLIFVVFSLSVWSNEIPTATNVKTLSLTPTAGEDLVCNFTFNDPENYEEQNSSYEWYKGGVDQSINSQTLDKNNLTVNDEWYCRVMPNDGIDNGSWVQSENNVTILTTIQNPTMYIDNTHTWDSQGYFDGKTTITNFTEELNTALSSCTEDSDGYCTINLTFQSDAVGELNLSRIGIYYENDTPDAEPKIIYVSANDQGFGENVTIDAEITDYNGSETIDSAWIGIIPPGETETNYTMWNTSLEDWTLNNFTDYTNGTYSYTVYANDSEGQIGSKAGTFDMFVNFSPFIQALNDTYGENEFVNITDPEFMEYYELDQFNNLQTSENLTFTAGQDIIRYLYLPQGANVTAATLNIWGNRTS